MHSQRLEAQLAPQAAHSRQAQSAMSRLSVPGCRRFHASQIAFAFKTTEYGLSSTALDWKTDLDRRSPCSLARNFLFPNAGNSPVKNLRLRLGHRRVPRVKPDLRHFRVFSLQIRDSHPETSSHQTARTAIWSVVDCASAADRAQRNSLDSVRLGGRALAHPNAIPRVPRPVNDSSQNSSTSSRWSQRCLHLRDIVHSRGRRNWL